MTDIHLAFFASSWNDRICTDNLVEYAKVMDDENELNLLSSFIFQDRWDVFRDELTYNSWMLDSGAFSAFTRGKIIDIDQYAWYCGEVMKREPKPVVMFTLDDIKSYKVSKRNTEYLWKKGIPVTPVYHRDEPYEVLKEYARTTPSGVVGLGGITADRKNLHPWLQACFKTAWPCKIHGLAVANRAIMLKFPFWSTDTSEWMGAVMRSVRWKKFGTLGQPADRNDTCLLSQIEFYLRLQRECKSRWQSTFEQEGWI